MDDTRLEDLLVRWEELRENGADTDIEEICRHCPELTQPLRERIAALKEMDWLDNARSVHLAPGVEPVPGYRLVSPIGKGGFAEVWRATGPEGGAVALKFVLRSGRGAAGELRGLDAVWRLQHPHLLRNLGAWQTRDYLVIGLELAEGTLQDQSGLPRERVFDYFRQAAEGIDFLHKQGMQHRDIKPSNLLLVGGGTLKVGDFGLVRHVAQTSTTHTGIMTASFAAPEFFDGRTTNQSDQYSLAVTYCQVRGGRLPFAGTPAQVMAGHLTKAPDLTMLPADERPAVARALSKRPADRWSSCVAFVQALEGAPVRHLKGRKLVIAAAVFLPLLLAVGVGVSVLLSRNGPDEKKPFVSLTSPGASLPSDFAAVPSRPLVKDPKPKKVEPSGVSTHRQFELFATPQNMRSVDVRHMAEPLNKLIAISNGTGGPRLWDVKTGKVFRSLPDVGGPAVAFSKTHAVSGHDHGRINLWDLSTTTVKQFAYGTGVSALVFSSDGKFVFGGGLDCCVQLWDVETGKKKHHLGRHAGFVMGVDINQDGTVGASASWDGTARLWDLVDGKSLQELRGHTNKVWCVKFCPDGQSVVSTGEDKTVRVWSVRTGIETGRMDLPSGGLSLAFSGTDKLLSGSGDGTVLLWDWRTRTKLATLPRLPGVTCKDWRASRWMVRIMSWVRPIRTVCIFCRFRPTKVRR
ncbi:MAG: serine/threonine-protein kinase [Gemmataceae bacterium]